MRGADKETILDAGRSPEVHRELRSAKIIDIANSGYRTKPRDDIRGTGYVVDSLEAALWCFLNTDSFRQAVLAAANLGFGDFDFYEIHEAFAAQTLATLKAWESEEFCRERLGRDRALGSIDRSLLNIKGGSLAIGHPFAATGARILGGLAKLIDNANGGRGLISICTAGGMGVTAIMEAASD